MYNRSLFLKLEYGRLNINDEVETKGNDYSRQASYGFLGFNLNFIKFKKNRLFFCFGAAVISKGFLPFLESSIKYLYIINKYIGISSSLKWPLIHGNNPIITIGIQIFNN